jgi:serine/threonine-protein kinase
VLPWYKKRGVIIATLLVLVAGLGGGGWWLSRSTKVSTGQEARRLAVLYFENATGSKELDYLSDGLTESLIDALSTVQSLYVVSRGGSALFRNSDVSTDSIARALDVGVLVRGSVAKDGDQYTVSVRLVDGASGVDLHRTTVSQPVANAINLQDSLAVQVAEAIRGQLGTEITMRERRDATTNEQAWVLVQRAELARKRAEDVLKSGDAAAGERAFAEAESLLTVAGALDPKWPDPLTQGASIAYRRARLAQADPGSVKRWIDSGLVLAEAAIVRSGENANALEARGNLRYLRGISGLDADASLEDQFIDLARQDLESAVRVNRIQAGAWATLSHLYYRVGTNLDVNGAAKNAYDSDAFLSNADVVLNRLFLSSYDLGDISPKADKYCKELNRRFPGTVNAARCQLFLFTTKQFDPDVPRAWMLADSLVLRSPAPRRAFQRMYADMYVAAVLARRGFTDSATRVVQRSLGDAQIDPQRELPYAGAFVYTLMADTTKAVGLLRQFFSANEGRRFAYSEDPGWWFRPIAGSKAFRDLVRPIP